MAITISIYWADLYTYIIVYIFQVDPAQVWLKDDIDEHAYSDGNFRLQGNTRVTPYSTLNVEGADQQQASSQSMTRFATAALPATYSSHGYRSVFPHKKIKSFTIKITKLKEAESQNLIQRGRCIWSLLIAQLTLNTCSKPSENVGGLTIC